MHVYVINDKKQDTTMHHLAITPPFIYSTKTQIKHSKEFVELISCNYSKR